MKDLPIGAITDYNEFKLLVVPQDFNRPSCTGCFFTLARLSSTGLSLTGCYKHGMVCTQHTRKDKKHVIFKLLE